MTSKKVTILNFPMVYAGHAAWFSVFYVRHGGNKALMKECRTLAGPCAKCRKRLLVNQE